MAPTLQIAIDCEDPARLADFWADAIGYELDPPPEGYASWDEWADEKGIPEENRNDANAIIDPAGLRPRIYFQRVPEPKSVKNRVHLDVKFTAPLDVAPEEAKNLVEGEKRRLEGIGATTVGPLEELGEYWVVMQDPEGNEFCLS